MNPELHARLMGERRPWTRKIEVTLDEEVIHALARFISEDHKGRLRDEEAVGLLVRDGLVGLGLLRPK